MTPPSGGEVEDETVDKGLIPTWYTVGTSGGLF
jgi:hypothetical protein